MPHGKYPVGNVLLSFAVLMGGFLIRILLVFLHIGLCLLAHTFFAHQWTFVFPTIINHWESYQAGLVTTLNKMKDVIWSGVGRLHSTGHSGAHTMFCTNIIKVVHFELFHVRYSDVIILVYLNTYKEMYLYVIWRWYIFLFKYESQKYNWSSNMLLQVS